MSDFARTFLVGLWEVFGESHLKERMVPGEVGLKTSVGAAPWRFRFGEADSGEAHVRMREICDGFGKRHDML